MPKDEAEKALNKANVESLKEGEESQRDGEKKERKERKEKRERAKNIPEEKEGAKNGGSIASGRSVLEREKIREERGKYFWM